MLAFATGSAAVPSSEPRERYLAQGEFRNVYTRHYDKEPRKGEIAVRKVFKTGTVFESKFFGDDLKAVDKASDFTAKFNCPRF